VGLGPPRRNGPATEATELGVSRGVKKLINEILFNSDVPGQHVRDEAVRERMLGAEHARGGRPHADRLARQTSLAKKIARTQNRHDRLFAALIDYGEFYTAFLGVFHAPGGGTLRVNLF
jgi:hypothetical protein